MRRFILISSLFALASHAQEPPVAPAPVAPALLEPAAPAPVAPEGPLTIAVLDLKAGPGTAGIAKALTTLVTAEVGAHAGYKAVSRNELQSILAHQADQRLLGCEEAQCLADIGKLAQARRVIAGSVETSRIDGAAADGTAGDATVLSLVLVDPEGPVILERLAWTWRSSADDMVDLARPAVDRLLHGKHAEAFVGDVDVIAPEGAVVFVDDKEIGAKPIRGLSIGVHRIEVRKPGYLPWGRDVAVSQGETHAVQADLIDELSVQPWYARWYVWGSALAGVVLVGGTVAAVGTYNYLSTPTKLVVGGPQ